MVSETGNDSDGGNILELKNWNEYIYQLKRQTLLNVHY